MIRRIIKRKAITRLLICIVVGLVTSVGVAWVAVVKLDKSTSDWIESPFYISTDSFPTWEYTQSQDLAYVGILSLVVQQFPNGITGIKKGPMWSIVRQDSITDNLKSQSIVLDEALGWPMVV